MINCIFYVNNNSNLCVFKILSKLPQTDYYEIEYLVGGNNKANLLNKKIDYMLYVNEDYTFYKKSYQSLALKLEMFNYKGIKKNEYEIYRKNNYENIMKLSVMHSDAVVMGSETLSPTLTKFIESSNKPFLPFASKDTIKEVYTSFIKNHVL